MNTDNDTVVAEVAAQILFITLYIVIIFLGYRALLIFNIVLLVMQVIGMIITIIERSSK